ncbi:hypothetical protein LMG8323_04270 [Ralstonia mannitolilytica]|nr:hypothetical protein LMG8323_04270 [Ralstonia mannitolilytica]
MNPATQPAYQASAVTDLTVFSELSSVASPNTPRPSSVAPVIERPYGAANDALPVAGTERELDPAYLTQGRRTPVLGALNPLESLCHYQRSRAGQGLVEGQVAPTCSEVQQAGFIGCPASGSCITPLGTRTVRPSDMEQWDAVPKFNKVSQLIVARAFLDAQFRDGAACVGKLFYGYDQGVFRLIDESELMQRLLHTFGYGIRVSDAQQMLKYVKTACRMSPDTFRTDGRLVCFRNGTLDVATGELGPHSPDHHLVSRINADYMPTAECPRFLRFLEEVFRSDEDREQRIRLRAELEGIIAWAVVGLRELLGAGEFTIPPSSAQALGDYRCEANPVQQFAEECLVGAVNGGGMAAKDVFAVYSRWCAAHGQSHGTSIGFGRALSNLGFQSRKSSHTVWLVSLRSGAGVYQAS